MGRRAMLGLAGFEWATSPKRTLSEASNNACEVPEVIDAARPEAELAKLALRAELTSARQKKLQAARRFLCAFFCVCSFI